MENEESTDLPILSLSKLAIETVCVDDSKANLIDSDGKSNGNNLIINQQHSTRDKFNQTNSINLINQKTKDYASVKSSSFIHPISSNLNSNPNSNLPHSFSFNYHYHPNSKSNNETSNDNCNNINSLLTIPVIHQLDNNISTYNGDEQKQQHPNIYNIDASTITSSSNLVSLNSLDSSSSSLNELTSNSCSTLNGCSNNTTSNFILNLASPQTSLSNITGLSTSSISLIKQHQAPIYNAALKCASANLVGTTQPSVSLMTNQKTVNSSSSALQQHQQHHNASSNCNLKTFTNCENLNFTALSNSINQNNQLFRGQDLFANSANNCREDMFIHQNNHSLMCFCTTNSNTMIPAIQQQQQAHLNHHYNPNNHQNSTPHPTGTSATNFHQHSLHHHFLQHQTSPQSQINNSSLGNQSFNTNNFNGNPKNMVNLNNILDLNSSNSTNFNRKFLNGSPINQVVQIGDSTINSNNNSNINSINNQTVSNLSSEDSLASLDQNNTVRLNKLRKRRKKDKRKFKQNLSASFEALNTISNSNNGNCKNNYASLSLSSSNSASIEQNQPINRFQLNSNLCFTFGQLSNDQYFYLNINQSQQPNQQTQSYTTANSPNLFKNQQTQQTNFNKNGLRIDKQNKKMISIGHFNNSLLGHLNQSNNQQQCNLIKQNLVLDKYYRSLPNQQQQLSTISSYRPNSNNYCTSNNLTTVASNQQTQTNYELASTSANSNLCTALLTPPHSPAHLIQSTMDSMFNLNSSNCSSNIYSPNSINQTNLFNNSNFHPSFSAFRPHYQHFELPTQKPPERPWITLRQPSKHRSSCIFTVMSYNVLSDKMVTRQLFGYCPNWALTWEYRRKAIMDEIRNYSADIITLQEVETEKFYNYFKPEMEKIGYDGIFSPKSRAKTMTENERKHVDGCAIFYRISKFSLVSEHLMEFNQLAMANAGGSDNMLNRVMTKDNIGLVALLQTKESAYELNGNNNAPLLDRLNNTPLGKNQTNGNGSTNGLSSTQALPLMVTTAHMHWDPEYSDVKLIQTMMLLHELRRVTQQASANYRESCQIPEGCSDLANSIPLIFCADLNSFPSSAVIEFLSTGKIAADHIDFKEIRYEDCLRKLSTTPESSTHYTHPFKMSKAYPDDLMPYTNYTADFKGVIDYIFYSKAHMSTLGLLGPLDPEWFKENKIVGCPHPYIPSDHFPLLAEFELPQPQSNNNSSTNQQGQQNQSNGVLRR